MGQLGAVLVGVRAVDGLPRLQAVDSSISSMAAWARTQTDPDRVLILSDDDGPVTIAGVSDAVEQLIDDHAVTKLLVYFAGHGFYKDWNEYWLLSNAARRAYEAVNLRGSMALAKRAGVEHVVFVSDACRTPPTSLTMADVSGSAVFPIQPLPATPGSVDSLQGARLGRPAYELRPPGATRHVAAFTEVLSAALNGRPPHFVAESAADGPVVFSHALQSHLPGELERYLGDLGLAVDVDQQPDLEIASPPGTWISRLPVGDDAAGVGTEPPPPPTPTPAEQARGELRSALSAARTIRSEWPEPDDAHETRPWPFFDQVVFSVTNQPIRELWSRGAPLTREWERSDDDGSFVAVAHPDDRGLPLPFTVQLASGDVFTVMAASGTRVHIDTDGSSLLGIRYDRRDRDEPATRADEVVRRAVEAASRRGFFRPDAEMADELIDSMRFRKTIDPALAIYTAYALFDRDDVSALHEMRSILRDASGYDFFDLAMLEGMLDVDRRLPVGGPGFPVLSQGWPLLLALSSPTPRQRALEAMRRPGLWTSFHAEAWDLLVEDERG